MRNRVALTDKAGNALATQTVGTDTVLKVVLSGGYVPSVQGTRASPIAISAATGITPSSGYVQLIYVVGNGGPITVTKNPQIAAGVNDGEVLEVRGTSDTNTVTLQNGTGLLLNGSVALGADWSIQLRWDLTNWCEISRRENA